MQSRPAFRFFVWFLLFSFFFSSIPEAIPALSRIEISFGTLAHAEEIDDEASDPPDEAPIIPPSYGKSRQSPTGCVVHSGPVASGAASAAIPLSLPPGSPGLTVVAPV
jgi:hypothetical protein